MGQKLERIRAIRMYRRDRKMGCRPRIEASGAAFTLVELLVAIAIIGVLISLLLPAIQSAREAARRTQCKNNIRQLALAALSYESAAGVLPPSAALEPSELIFKGYGQALPYTVVDHEQGKQFSWAVLLLPYLEQQALFDRFDTTKSVFAQSAEPQETFVAPYICPSDEAQGRYFADDELTAGKRFAKGNYAAFVSPYHIDMQLLYRGALVALGQPTSRIEDGLSNTIAFSEVRSLDWEQDERGAWALPWAGASILSFDMHPLCYDGRTICPEQTHYVPNPKSLGFTQIPNVHNGLSRDTLHLCEGDQQVLSDLERMPCTAWKWPIGLLGYYSASPRSRHPGGVHAALLDGSVRFITDDIDEFTMAYLVSIEDGELPVSPD